MNARVSIDLTAFQQLCRGEIAETTGYEATTHKEIPVELILQDIGLDVMLASIQGTAVKTIESERLLEQDTLLPILDAMDTYGGSFVRILSAMTRRGDHQNRLLCVMTWLKYFLEYKNR